jgi:uncharacterized protein
MAAFECDRCGKCCISLGRHITIERQLNDRDYYCRSTIDNAIFPVHVDPAYREEIADEFTTAESEPISPEKRPCTFLRKNPEGDGTACAIYAMRPKVCRDFRCYHMVIRNLEGTVSGKVMGKSTLRTDDAALENLWNERVAAIPSGDAAVWRKNVVRILSENNYRTEVVE